MELPPNTTPTDACKYMPDSTNHPTQRAMIVNWSWLAYNSLSLASISIRSYSDGLGAWGRICGAVTLILTIVFAINCLVIVGQSSAQRFMTTTFRWVIFGYIFGAASFWGEGLSLSILLLPVLLSGFFVTNQRFTNWADAKP